MTRLQIFNSTFVVPTQDMDVSPEMVSVLNSSTLMGMFFVALFGGMLCDMFGKLAYALQCCQFMSNGRTI